MKKKRYTMKTAILTAVLIIIVMLVLQFVLLAMNNTREAENTTKAYLAQTEVIIEKNRQEEEILAASLREDYIILAKAVAYYLDSNPEAEQDSNELQKICDLMSIDEIHIFDTTGTIIYSSVPEDVGYSFDSGEQISYFKPMLTDKNLTMFQDITPNTAEGKPMVYAITWNEAGTQIVQIGVEPVRLLNEFEANSIESVVKNLALTDNMSIVVADASTLEVVAAKNSGYVGKQLSEVTNIKQESIQDSFAVRTKLADDPGSYYCSIGFTDDYCICVFLNYHFFTARTVEALIIVFVYLAIAFFVIMLVIRRLRHSRQENDQHLQVFEALSEIYYSLHLVDLKENTTMEYTSRNQVKDTFRTHIHKNADQAMIEIMKATMTDEYLARGLEFTDLTTVAERLKGKKSISMELLGKNVGWISMSLITFEEKDGVPEKIIIATQIIDEAKKKTESLYEKSHMDELTGCGNRRAYNTDLCEYEDCQEVKEFAYISFDVNGLKTVNDDLGHDAGDELINGAVSCMKAVFLKHGKIYRLGGDEFAGLISADAELMKMLCEDFDERIRSWKGEMVKSISVSYGYVLSSEAQGKPMSEIAGMADKRMYEAKAKYYQQKGIDRRRT